MNKLIRAGIKRMLRIKTFYICLAVLFFIDGFDIIKEYLFPEPGRNLPSPDGYLISGFLTIVLLSAILISSFLGSEHQFGTLRNKVVAGNDRFRIYVSSFVVCFISVMLMYAFVWLMTSVLGTLLLGGYTISGKELLILMLISFLGFVAMTALFVMIALCIHTKSMSSVTAVITAFMLVIFGVMTVQMLSIPQYISVDEIAVSELSKYEISPEDPMKVINPDYVGGSTRKVFEVMHEWNPVSKILSSSGELDAKDVFIPVAEIVVLLVSGMIIFKKRDLK